jgi:hypothetical protein
VAACATAIQRKSLGDPVPGNAFDPGLRGRFDHLLEVPVAFRAAVEPNVRGNPGVRIMDRSPLACDVGALEEKSPLRPVGQSPVPGEDHPVLDAGQLQHFIVREPSDVTRVAPDEAKVPGQPPDHLVCQPSG